MEQNKAGKIQLCFFLPSSLSASAISPWRRRGKRGGEEEGNEGRILITPAFVGGGRGTEAWHSTMMGPRLVLFYVCSRRMMRKQNKKEKLALLCHFYGNW